MQCSFPPVGICCTTCPHALHAPHAQVLCQAQVMCIHHVLLHAFVFFAPMSQCAYTLMALCLCSMFCTLGPCAPCAMRRHRPMQAPCICAHTALSLRAPASFVIEKRFKLSCFWASAHGMVACWFYTCTFAVCRSTAVRWMAWKPWFGFLFVFVRDLHVPSSSV